MATVVSFQIKEFSNLPSVLLHCCDDVTDPINQSNYLRDDESIYRLCDLIVLNFTPMNST